MTMNSERTAERVLIVGGSSGMGLALARRLLEEGAHVIIAGRSEERLARARQSLGEVAHLRTAALDIAEERQVAAFFAQSGPLNVSGALPPPSATCFPAR